MFYHRPKALVTLCLFYQQKQNALQRMKMISVGKSSDKLEQGITRAEDIRNLQSDNANLTALVLKVVS